MADARIAVQSVALQGMTASNAELALAWQMKAAGLPEPVREFRFDPKRMWRLDFAFPAHKAAVEIEGGIHSNGRHVRGAGFEADLEKYGEALVAGWLVLRVSTRMVDDGRALQLVERMLALQEI